MDCSLPGSSVHGILQARILEWVAIPFSRGVRLHGSLDSSCDNEEVPCGKGQASCSHMLTFLGPRNDLLVGCTGHVCVWALNPCSGGDQPYWISWTDLENIAEGGVSWEEACILTKQAHVQGFLASSHRPGLPEPPS